MAYKDWKYFLSEAETILKNEGIKYERVTSGYNKGQYTAKLMPVVGVSDINEYYQNKYLNGNRNCRLKYYTGSSSTKEQVVDYLKRDIAGSLTECYRATVNHPLSELWDCWKNNKEGADIYFDGEVGRDIIDYFNVLSGEVNPENWKDYKYHQPSGRYGSTTPQTLTSFKEFYFYIKNKAKEEYLNKIAFWYSNKKDMPKTFIWDEENIPEVKKIENILDGNSSKHFDNIDVEEHDVVKQNEEIPNRGTFKVGYRKEEFLKGTILAGRHRPIIFANGEKHDSQYAICELDEIIASHNEKSFQNTENYPTNSRGENINDRNYSNDVNAQAKVLEMAQNFEPEIQVSTSVGPSGLPVITVDGVVVSGNNRTMSLKLMVEQFPENYQNYLKVLAKEIDCFGFEKSVGTAILMGDKIALKGSSFDNPIYVKFKKPILIRIDPDFPEYTTTEMAKYNKDTKKSERPIDKAIKLSSQLSDNPKCFEQIANLVGKFEIFSDLYSSVQDIKMLQNLLISCNIITPNEINSYFQGVTMTNAGKDFLENLLAGMILNKDALLASEVQGVKQNKQKIITALPILIKNSTLPEGSLKDDLTQAIILDQKIVSSGLGFDYYFGQMRLGEEDNSDYSRNVLVMNRLLQKGSRVFKQALESYTNGVLANTGPSMFDEEKPSVEQIFKTTIESKLDAPELKIIDKKTITLPVNKKEIIEKRVKGLEISLNLIKDELKKNEISKRIKGLKIAQKMY